MTIEEIEVSDWRGRESYGGYELVQKAWMGMMKRL